MKDLHKKLQKILRNHNILLTENQLLNFITHIDNYNEFESDIDKLINDDFPNKFLTGILDIDQYDFSVNEIILLMFNSNGIENQIIESIKLNNEVVIANLETVSTISSNRNKTLILNIDFFNFLSLPNSVENINTILYLNKQYKNIVLLASSPSGDFNYGSKYISSKFFNLIRHLSLWINFFKDNDGTRAIFVKNRYGISNHYYPSFDFARKNVGENLYTFPISEINDQYLFSYKSSLITTIDVDTISKINLSSIMNDYSLYNEYFLQDIIELTKDILPQKNVIKLHIQRNDNELTIDQFASLLNYWVEKCIQLKKPLIIINELDQVFKFGDDPSNNLHYNLLKNIANNHIQLKSKKEKKDDGYIISTDLIIKKHPLQKESKIIKIQRGKYE